MAITYRTRNPDLRNRALRAIEDIRQVVDRPDAYGPAERCRIVQEQWARLAKIDARKVAQRSGDKRLAEGIARAAQAAKSCSVGGFAGIRRARHSHGTLKRCAREALITARGEKPLSWQRAFEACLKQTRNRPRN